MARKKPLEGKTFGTLTVVGVSGVSRNGHYRYHVRCTCGNEKTVLGTHLISGKIVSCGCSKGVHKNWKGFGTVSLTYFASVKRGASGGKGRKAIEFDVTIEDMAYQLDEVQKGKCNLSGLPISIYDKTASLDRIDSSKGYTKENIQWLHKDVNMMKRHYSEQYFMHLVREVYWHTNCKLLNN
jgi:hypothetical protein